MSRFWKRRRDPFDLEAALRATRPEPSTEFVRALTDDIRGSRHRFRARRARLAPTAGITAVVLIALASVGGFGYAGAQVMDAVDAVSDSLEDGALTTEQSPGENQYFGARCGQEPPKKPADPEKRARCPMQAGKVKTAEGNAGTTTASLPIYIVDYTPEVPVSVTYRTVSGTAKSPSDYQAMKGKVTFNAGETVKFIPLAIVGDTRPEADDVFYVKLSDPSANAEIIGDTGDATILNDDLGDVIDDAVDVIDETAWIILDIP
jgi:hypothetical protein